MYVVLFIKTYKSPYKMTFSRAYTDNNNLYTCNYMCIIIAVITVQY